MTLSLFAPRRSQWDLLMEDLPGEANDPLGLRWFQREAHDAFFEGVPRFTSQLIVKATGLGKTQTFCAIIYTWISNRDNGPALILAHRDELVEQARKRYEQMFGEPVEIEQGPWTASSKARIVVGSLQSFHKKRLERLGKNRFGLVVLDEAHHGLAPSFRRAFEYFDAKRLGVTATADRGDGKAMGDMFERVAYSMDIEQGIEQGYLAPIVGQQITLAEIDLGEVSVSKTDKDLDKGQLDTAMAKAVEGIVHEVVRLHPDRKGICFFPGVRSAEYAMHAFNRVVPSSAVFVSGETDKDTRRILMREFKAGRYRYLCNCEVATEGFDAPGADMVVMGRPTLSRQKYTQMAGRGTRVLEGTVDHIMGKERASERRAAIAQSRKPDCLLLDFVGNSGKHALVSPEDLLGGTYTDEEIEHAKSKRPKGTGGGTPDDVRERLKQARREIQALAASTRAAKVVSVVNKFNPFALFGMDPAHDGGYTGKYGVKKATEGRIAALRSMGVPEKDLANMTNRDASRLLDEMARRRKAGLASFKQTRALAKFGVLEKDISFARASAALDYIGRTCGYGKTSAIDPHQLNNIVMGRREAGEEG